MLLHLLVAPAPALTCEDVQLLIDARVPTAIVVQTIAAASPPPSEADIACLMASGVDTAVVTAAKGVVRPSRS